MSSIMDPIVESEILSQVSGLGMLVCLAASLSLPWISKASGKGYRIKWAALLAAVATCLFLAMHFTMPQKYNIRVDLLICPVLLLIDWIHCGVLAFVTRSPQSHDSVTQPSDDKQ